MWLLGLIFFVVVSIIFSGSGGKSSGVGGGIPYRNRKQIRNFIRK
jgi:hypothetical protein